MSRRIDRVNFTLRKELGTLIAENLSDPRLAPMTSVTRVETASDLGAARVYISVLGTLEEQNASMEALRSAAGLLRNLLGSKIHMRRVPQLHFELDTNIEEGAEFDVLIRRVTEEDEARRTARGESSDTLSDTETGVTT